MDTKEIMNRVEAVLFMSPEPLSVKRIAGLVGATSTGVINECAAALAEEYRGRNAALEIVGEEGEYFMRVKDAFTDVVAKVAGEAELSRSELKTLAYIAKKEGKAGVMQFEVVRALGPSVYQHIQGLMQSRFVAARPKGRSRVLTTTAKFRKYFKVEGI